jgi:hypothetical protein
MSASKSRLNLDALVLQQGAHKTADEGMCLMEAVAWWAGQRHTDQPPCVSPVLGAFGRSWNDSLDTGTRQELKRFIPLLPGTVGDGQDVARSFLAMDWAARVCAPAFLDNAGLAMHASTLRTLGPVTGPRPLVTAMPVLAAARDAARDAARAKLAPVVTRMQASAFDLFTAMINPNGAASDD